jgi:carboxylate-amine ligase
VIEAHFGESPPLSLGVEEELMILDAETLEPAGAVEVLVRGAAELDLPGTLKTELHASVVELNTRICADVDEAVDALRTLRRAAGGIAAEHGLALAAAGSHPTARLLSLPVVPEERYLAMLREVGYAAKRQAVNGLHVHVGVGTADACWERLESVLGWLPVVLALSANSPFVDGADSGFRSARADALLALPSGGAPPVFRTWADWEARTAGVDYRRLHWDVRPHPDYGTLEVRVADQQTDVRRSAELAAMIQGLVLAAFDTDSEPYDRDVYTERRARAAVEPGGPEADRQLEIGLPGVVRDLADRSLA